MIRIGTAGIPISTKEHNSIEGIKRVAELGLNAMEVEFVRGVNMRLDTAKELGKTAKEYNIELSIHAPYYINLASHEKRKIEESKIRILDSMERGYAMGATIVVAHPGFYGKHAKDVCAQIITENCKDIVKRAKSKGWDVILGLETMGKQGQYGTLDELLTLSKEVKNCQPVVDFAHIFARNGGSIDFKEVLDKMKDFKHIHSHFSGINYSVVGIGKGNERNHLPLSCNNPDYHLLAKELAKRKIDITLISESPIIEEDSLKLKEMIKKIK